MDMIKKYFPHLEESQYEAFKTMLQLYPEWNEKINVISRRDIDNLEANHILHSLAIAKYINFLPDARVLDFGTGGGFPGIPLAVLFPETNFHLVDRTGKKIRVASEIAQACNLGNVKFTHGDVADINEKYDFVVSRAVMPQPDLVKISRSKISSTSRHAIPNGLIALKGGDLSAELKPIASQSETVDITNYFPEDCYKDKKIVFTAI